MEFQYTLNPNSESPIMLIEGPVGEPEGVMAKEFCKELMFLDTLGKTTINIWINSPGGSVMDSDLIISTILKSETKVDTHNVGTCASCAGAIFLAGRNRYMMDFAKFMIHGISGASNNQEYKVFTDGIVTNLTTRCKLDEATARRFMSTETWLNADQCQEYGIAQKETSNEYNRPRRAVENNAESWRYFRPIVNKLSEPFKPKTMSNKITNKLNLVDGADEASQLAAIERIENRASSAEKALADQKADFETKITNLQTQIDTLKNEKAKVESDLKAINDAKELAEKEAEKTAITELVNQGEKLGKISNKAEFLKKVENMKKDEVKNLLDLIPAKVPGAVMNFGEGKEKTFTAQDINNMMLEKHNKNYKNN